MFSMNHICFVFSLGSACSHVGALLFKLYACSQMDMNKTACTSQLCAWKQSRKQADPAPVKQINFKKVKITELTPDVKSSETKSKGFSFNDPGETGDHYHIQKLKELRVIKSKGAVFSIICKWAREERSSDTETADETDTNSLPEPLTFLFDSSTINDNSADVADKCETAYENYVKDCSDKQFYNLCKITKLQNMSDKWKLHRAGRITASISKQAFTTDISNPSKTFINTVMQYSKEIKTSAMAYGIQSEPKARNSYKKCVEKQHKNFKLNETGLHVNVLYPQLGASPDGLISCDCHGKGILEIKCPFKEWVTL